jgi:hypothetical protein
LEREELVDELWGSLMSRIDSRKTETILILGEQINDEIYESFIYFAAGASQI